MSDPVRTGEKKNAEYEQNEKICAASNKISVDLQTDSRCELTDR